LIKNDLAKNSFMVAVMNIFLRLTFVAPYRSASPGRFKSASQLP
jgi:hypothetical protein